MPAHINADALFAVINAEDGQLVFDVFFPSSEAAYAHCASKRAVLPDFVEVVRCSQLAHNPVLRTPRAEVKSRAARARISKLMQQKRAR